MFYTQPQDGASVAPIGNWLDNTSVCINCLPAPVSFPHPPVSWDHILTKPFAFESLPKSYLLEEPKL